MGGVGVDADGRQRFEPGLRLADVLDHGIVAQFEEDDGVAVRDDLAQVVPGFSGVGVEVLAVQQKVVPDLEEDRRSTPRFFLFAVRVPLVYLVVAGRVEVDRVVVDLLRRAS